MPQSFVDIVNHMRKKERDTTGLVFVDRKKVMFWRRNSRQVFIETHLLSKQKCQRLNYNAMKVVVMISSSQIMSRI